MEHPWEQLKTVVWNTVWAANLAALPTGQAVIIRGARTAHMVLRELVDGHLNLRAASLVYTTLLSLIPALAVSFAVLKAFNYHERLAPTLLQVLQPLGTMGPELTGQIVGFVEHLDLARLGSAGVAVLFLTVVSLLHKIEQALNQAWRVTRQRGFFERFSGYLTVVMVGPVLVAMAVGLSASFASSDLVQTYAKYQLLGFLLHTVSQAVPYGLVIAAFTFLYIYIPNTRVTIKSALVGGVVAGILWGSLGWVFAAMVVNSARYTVVYSGFAIVILFMMWLYIGWLIMLIGGSVAFYHQNPEYLGLLTHELQVSNRVRERMGLAACFRIARRFHSGAPPPTLVELARDLRVPVAPLQALLSEMESAGIVTRTGPQAEAYLPARDPSTVTLAALLGAVRGAHETGHINTDRLVVDEPVERLVAGFDRMESRAMGELTLETLVHEAQASDAQRAPVPLYPADRKDS